MNKLTTETRANVLKALVEGCSINSTSRMTGVSKPTILKLLVDAGRVCADYQDHAFRNLKCERIQVDEIWSFCYAKQRNVPEEKKSQFGYGDVWTWTAIDADTKLVPSWLIGRRDAVCASEFLTDLAGRLANRVQLTSDGHNSYLIGVEAAFGSDIDYAQLVKLYGTPIEEHRYSPPQCIGIRMTPITGDPDPGHVSTSYVERQNLTMRMHMRRFTRLTNGFSKKVVNHAAAVALHYMYYNFCKVHKTLRVTPAMEAGVSDHVWEVEEIVALLEAVEPKGQKRGPYKKRTA
jgi:IS1 family transposase